MRTKRKMSLGFGLSLGLSLLIVIPLVLVLALLRSDDPQQALRAACGNGDLLQARVALLCGADINKHVGGGFPNIVTAAWRGQVLMIEFLLSHGADIETKDKFGGTALSRAAQGGQFAAVEYLLAHGANPNVEDKEGGNTPWDLAAMNCKNPHLASDSNYQRIAVALKKAGGHANATRMSLSPDH